MSIKEYFPDKYGSIFQNVDNIGKDKIGIVIPTFGREDYVKTTLASISKSNLDNCVICIVDETNSHLNHNVPNFIEYTGIDSEGYDLAHYNGLDINDLSQVVLDHNNCVAFNHPLLLKATQLL